MLAHHFSQQKLPTHGARNSRCDQPLNAHAPRSQQTFHPVPTMKLVGIVFKKCCCWPTLPHIITAGDADGWCENWPVRSTSRWWVDWRHISHWGIEYGRGLPISLLHISECSFHMGYEWRLTNVNMTCDKFWEKNNYFVLELGAL